MNRPLRPRTDLLRRLALPIALILLGAVVRAPLPWTDAPFDVDEALYATFARQISHENNPFLLGQAVDKPPLAFFAIALSFKLFTDPGEWAARLPAFYASVLGLAALWALARGLYRDNRVAALAVLIVALAPLDAALAGTVFVDPLAALFTLLAYAGASRRRWGATALFGALAFATKQSALQALPLILMLGLSARRRRQPSLTIPLILTALVVAYLPFAWDAARDWQGGWWALGVANNAPGRFIRPDEALPRLLTWLGHLSQALGGPLIPAIAGIGSATLLLRAGRNPREHDARSDLILALYCLGWLLVYWLLALNTYERYVHAILPLIALLAARSAVVSGKGLRSSRWRFAALLPPLLIIASLIAAPRASPALESARARHRGIVEVAAYLNTLPPGTVVYDRWVGWLLGWYTGQQRPPGMWLRVTYYPTPEALVAGALSQPDPQPRYFVVPAWAEAAPWLRALDNAGFSPEPVMEHGQFTVYRLLPP